MGSFTSNANAIQASDVAVGIEIIKITCIDHPRYPFKDDSVIIPRNLLIAPNLSDGQIIAMIKEQESGE